MPQPDPAAPAPAVPARADVVIVGGGIVGSATAYFLTLDPAMAGRVVVVSR